MKYPTFSIVIPTYNRGYILWKTILSIQKQLYPDWEVLVVDDGSTDNTKQIVAEFQKDPRIKYFFQKHSHVSEARNFGMRKAIGDIITYVDSDDCVYEHFLSTPLEYFQKYPEKMFAIPNHNRRIELYDENYHLVDFTEVSSSQKEIIILQDFYHWKVRTCSTGLFHKKETIDGNLEWDSSIKSFQDWDFVMQLGNKYPDGFLHIPYVLFEYLQKHGGNGICSNMTYEDWAKDFEVVYQKHKNDPLLKGQEWYPQKIEKYVKLQAQLNKGEIPPFIYKHFPQYGKK